MYPCYLLCSLRIFGIIAHKYPLHWAYIGISHRSTLVGVHPTIPCLMYVEVYAFSFWLPQLLPQWSTIWATSPPNCWYRLHPDDICKVKRSCTNICAFASKNLRNDSHLARFVCQTIPVLFVRCYAETYTRDESTCGPGKDEEQSRPIQELQRQIQVEIPVSTEIFVKKSGKGHEKTHLEKAVHSLKLT